MSKITYTVYDNKTGFPVAVSQTSKDCAKQMGIRMSSWYIYVCRCNKGTNKRWTILKDDKREPLSFEGGLKIDKLPPMVRASRLAELLSTTCFSVVDFCERNGVPIIEAGVRKIKMIPKDKFFEKLKRSRQ